MKIIINNINIYNNVVIINNVIGNKTIISNNSPRSANTNREELNELTACITSGDSNNHVLIAKLEARILQSEGEKQELLAQLNNKNESNLV